MPIFHLLSALVVLVFKQGRRSVGIMLVLLATLLINGGLSLPNQVVQRTFTSMQSGPWEDGATWGNVSPGIKGIDFPDEDDQVWIGSHTVSLRSSRPVLHGKIIVSQTGILEISHPQTTANFQQKGGFLEVHGTLRIRPSLHLARKSKLHIFPGGQVYCQQALQISDWGEMRLEADAICHIEGDFVLTGTHVRVHGQNDLEIGKGVIRFEEGAGPDNMCERIRLLKQQKALICGTRAWANKDFWQRIQAQFLGHHSLINWTVKELEGGESFVVERAIGNEDFQVVGSLEHTSSQGTSHTFHWVDHDVQVHVEKPMRYRIRFFDQQAHQHLSPVMKLDHPPTRLYLNLHSYPDWIRNTLSFTYNLPEAAPVGLSIYNMAGDPVMQQAYAGAAIQSLKLGVDQFPVGNYILQVKADEDQASAFFQVR